MRFRGEPRMQRINLKSHLDKKDNFENVKLANLKETNRYEQGTVDDPTSQFINDFRRELFTVNFMSYKDLIAMDASLKNETTQIDKNEFMKALTKICNNDENLANQLVACHSQNLPAHAIQAINAGISTKARNDFFIKNSKSSQHNYQTENNSVQLHGQSYFEIFDILKNRIIGITSTIKTQFQENNGGMELQYIETDDPLMHKILNDQILEKVEIEDYSLRQTAKNDFIKFYRESMNGPDPFETAQLKFVTHISEKYLHPFQKQQSPENVQHNTIESLTRLLNTLPYELERSMEMERNFINIVNDTLNDKNKLEQAVVFAAEINQRWDMKKYGFDVQSLPLNTRIALGSAMLDAEFKLKDSIIENKETVFKNAIEHFVTTPAFKQVAEQLAGYQLPQPTPTPLVEKVSVEKIIVEKEKSAPLKEVTGKLNNEPIETYNSSPQKKKSLYARFFGDKTNDKREVEKENNIIPGKTPRK